MNGLPVPLLGDHGVVAQINLGIEAARQHSFIVADELVINADVFQSKAGQRDHVRIRLGVKPR